MSGPNLDVEWVSGEEQLDGRSRLLRVPSGRRISDPDHPSGVIDLSKEINKKNYPWLTSAGIRLLRKFAQEDIRKIVTEMVVASVTTLRITINLAQNWRWIENELKIRYPPTGKDSFLIEALMA